jgi:hypothetical protein
LVGEPAGTVALVDFVYTLSGLTTPLTWVNHASAKRGWIGVFCE